MPFSFVENYFTPNQFDRFITFCNLVLIRPTLFRCLRWWFITKLASFVIITSLTNGTSWSYGTWIYNYLCNQYLSPLTLWVRIPLMTRYTRYNIMCLSVTFDRSVVFRGYYGFGRYALYNGRTWVSQNSQVWFLFK